MPTQWDMWSQIFKQLITLWYQSFQHFLSFVEGIHWCVGFPHKGPVMQTLHVIAWTSGWTNSPVASYLRCHGAFITVMTSFWLCFFNTLKPKQNGQYFADNIFKCIFLNENVRIAINISVKFVHKDRINNIPALVQKMVWCCLVDNSLSLPMMFTLLTHICITQPQWVKKSAVHMFFAPEVSSHSHA